MNGLGKCKHNCDVRQNGMSQEISKALEGLGEKITHPGGFSQRKCHLSKSLKEG